VFNRHFQQYFSYVLAKLLLYYMENIYSTSH